MLEKILVITICIVWMTFCACILLYLNLDKLRTHTHMLWKSAKADTELWMGHSYRSKKPEEQVCELLDFCRTGKEKPDWWEEFIYHYNVSAEKYSKRLEAPVFSIIARLLRFRKMPEI